MKACHTCLQILEEGTFAIKLCDIFCDGTPDKDMISLRDKFVDYVPEFVLSFGSNAFLCQSCAVAITGAHKFKQKCLETQSKIHSNLQQMPVKTEFNIEDIAMHYRRLEIVAAGGDAAIDVQSQGATNILNVVKDEPLLPVDVGNVGVKEETKNFDVIKCESSSDLKVHVKEEPSSDDDGNKPSTSDLCVKQEIYKCTLCNYTNKSYSKLCFHMILHNSAKGQKSCTECSFTTNIDSKLVMHMKTHPELEVGLLYFCPPCDFRTYNRKEMISHNFRHNLDQNYRQSCHICDWIFPDKTALANHLMTNHAARSYFVNCRFCNYYCDVPQCLQIHEKKHNTRLKFGCSKCSLSFKTNKKLKKHMKTKHSNRKRKLDDAAESDLPLKSKPLDKMYAGFLKSLK